MDKELKDKLKDLDIQDINKKDKPVVQRSLGYEPPKRHIKNKTIRINKHV